jgi:hypothetical protein
MLQVVTCEIAGIIYSSLCVVVFVHFLFHSKPYFLLILFLRFLEGSHAWVLISVSLL